MPTPPGQGETVPFTAQELAEFEAKLDENDLGDWAEIAKLKRLCALARKATWVGVGGLGGGGGGGGGGQIIGLGFGDVVGGVGCGGTFTTKWGGWGVATDWSEVTRQLGERMAKIEADQTAILRRVSGPRVRLPEQAPEPTLSDAEKREVADRMSFAEVGKSTGFKQMMADAGMREASDTARVVNWIIDGGQVGAAPVAGTTRTSPVDESVSCYAMLVVNGRWPTRQEEQAWQVICVDGIVIKNTFGPCGKLSVVLGPEPGSFISFGLDYWERLWADHIPAPVPLSLEGCMAALTARREADQREAAVTFEAASQQTALALSMREQRDAAVSAMNQARAELSRWRSEVREANVARIRDDDALAKQLNRINEAPHCAVGTPLKDVVDRVLSKHEDIARRIRESDYIKFVEMQQGDLDWLASSTDGDLLDEIFARLNHADRMEHELDGINAWLAGNTDAAGGTVADRIRAALDRVRAEGRHEADVERAVLVAKLALVREALGATLGADGSDDVVDKARNREPLREVLERELVWCGVVEEISNRLKIPYSGTPEVARDGILDAISALERDLELARAERGLAWRDADDSRAELKLAQKPGATQQAISPLASEQILDDVIRAVMSSVGKLLMFEIKHRAADHHHPPRTELHVRDLGRDPGTNEVSSNHVLAYVELGELRLAPVNPSGDYSQARLGNDYGWAWPARIRSALAGSKP